MKPTRKAWQVRKKNTSTSTVPDDVKQQVKMRADECIESVIKPKYLKAPPENPQVNYLVDIYSKWYRHYFYFCATYNCPGPYALSPTFDTKFARMEYLPNGHYTVAYLRHTDQWFALFHDIPLDEALQHICDDPDFFP